MKVGQYLRWAPFVVVVLLSAIVAADRAPDSFPETFVGQLFIFLPPAAMVAIGGTRSRRGALIVALATFGTMLALDLAPLAHAGAAGSSPTVRMGGGDLSAAAEGNAWLTPGRLPLALRILPEAAFLRGGEGFDFSSDSDLVSATWAMLKLSYFLVPLGLIGWALGVEAWIHRRVTFATPRDELVARAVLDVGLAAFAITFALNISVRATFGVLSGNQAWTVSIPFTLIFLAGLPGWFTQRLPRGDAS